MTKSPGRRERRAIGSTKDRPRDRGSVENGSTIPGASGRVRTVARRLEKDASDDSMIGADAKTFEQSKKDKQSHCVALLADLSTHGGIVDFPRQFSRMRSEGFSFNSGGRALFATCCFSIRNRPQPFATVRNRSQPSATVRNRPQPSAAVRSRALRRCHWGKLLERVSDENVTCQIGVK